MATQDSGATTRRHVCNVFGKPLYERTDERGWVWHGTWEHALACGIDTSELVPYMDSFGPFVKD